MNKIEEILNNIYNEKYCSNYKINYSKQCIIEAMKEFSKICFEDGRKYHLHNTYKYENYEDFLKEIENE